MLLENLHNKYAITTKEIITALDQQASLLDDFLMELGYE